MLRLVGAIFNEQHSENQIPDRRDFAMNNIIGLDLEQATMLGVEAT